MSIIFWWVRFNGSYKRSSCWRYRSRRQGIKSIINL